VQIPSSYVISDDPPPESPAVAQRLQASRTDVWRDYAMARYKPNLYPLSPDSLSDVNAWRSQFIDRPHPVELLRVR